MATIALLCAICATTSVAIGSATIWTTIFFAAAQPVARAFDGGGSGRPLHCPTGGPLHQSWPQFFEQVEKGQALIRHGRVSEASVTLADAITVATRDVAAAHECSIGIAAAYRVLALAHATDPRVQGTGLAYRRALQVALRFAHLASNWITHFFVKHEAKKVFIDESAWPITLQESVDEHRTLRATLESDGRQAGHRPRSGVNIPHDFRFPGLSIAIVSLCAYPEGHALPRYAMSNQQIYAERHGYHYYAETRRLEESRPVAWGKIKLVYEFVRQRRWDWVMWADCDVYFMNLTVTLDSLLYRYGGERSLEARQPLELDPNFHFLVTEDHAMLNTGIFLARSSAWSEAMLERVWGPDDSAWTNHPWWEQAAMSWYFWSSLHERFRQTDHVAWAKQNALVDSDDMQGIYPDPVRVAPQIEFNSYHPVTSRFVADTWAPGKFVIAFNGVSSSSSPNVAQELYKTYYERFCALNRVEHLCLEVIEPIPWMRQQEPERGTLNASSLVTLASIVSALAP
eukprot:TRINITY_DN34526_c0_g2_i1.p1 TRINITY_DN34526_c0_g2~~TRINITY_DN34526_c0_g2_i1.p1  ORF type:complete len:514 (-),score=77.13 TRINITY_DN34526_c0_g2_i1:257-1798(-)